MFVYVVVWFAFAGSMEQSDTRFYQTLQACNERKEVVMWTHTWAKKNFSCKKIYVEKDHA